MTTPPAIAYLAEYDTLRFERIPHVVLRIPAAATVDGDADGGAATPGCGPWSHADHLQILFGAADGGGGGGGNDPVAATIHTLQTVTPHATVQRLSLGLVATQAPSPGTYVSDFFLEYARVLLAIVPRIAGYHRGRHPHHRALPGDTTDVDAPPPLRAVWDSSRLADTAHIRGSFRFPAESDDDDDDTDNDDNDHGAREGLRNACEQAYIGGDARDPACVAFVRFMLTAWDAGHIWFVAPGERSPTDTTVRWFLGTGASSRSSRRQRGSGNNDSYRKRTRLNSSAAIAAIALDRAPTMMDD
jgi:hypothetical protein